MAVIPILRAGLGMVEGMLTMVPAAENRTYWLIQGSGNFKAGGILL